MVGLLCLLIAQTTYQHVSSSLIHGRNNNTKSSVSAGTCSVARYAIKAEAPENEDCPQWRRPQGARAPIDTSPQNFYRL